MPIHDVYIGYSRVMRHLKMKLFSIFQLVEPYVMRQIQLEMIFFLTKNILGAEEDRWVSRPKSEGDGKNEKHRFRHSGVAPTGCLCQR